MDGRELRSNWRRDLTDRADAAALHRRMRDDILKCADVPVDQAIAAARMFCEFEASEPTRSALRKLIESDPGVDAQSLVAGAASPPDAIATTLHGAVVDESMAVLYRTRDELETALQAGLRHAVTHESLRKCRDDLRAECATLTARLDLLLQRRETLLNG